MPPDLPYDPAPDLPPDLPYDPAPELAALLRVLSWAQPIGPAWPGSSADLAGRLQRGLGLPADATTAEYEAALAPPRTGAATWTGSGATQPGHETARAGPPPPGAGSPARRHRGPAQCAGERRGAHAMIHDAEALARLLSLATGGLLAPGACEEACDWPGGDNGDALKGDRTVRVRPPAMTPRAPACATGSCCGPRTTGRGSSSARSLTAR